MKRIWFKSAFNVSLILFIYQSVDQIKKKEESFWLFNYFVDLELNQNEYKNKTEDYLCSFVLFML